MLAGNWPYWNPQDVNKHPDELLRARLSFADSNKSLVEQDLVELAEGLEGRSTNPVSLLVSELFGWMKINLTKRNYAILTFRFVLFYSWTVYRIHVLILDSKYHHCFNIAIKQIKK